MPEAAIERSVPVVAAESFGGKRRIRSCRLDAVELPQYLPTDRRPLIDLFFSGLPKRHNCPSQFICLDLLPLKHNLAIEFQVSNIITFLKVDVVTLLAKHQADYPERYPYVFIPPVRYDCIQMRRNKGNWTVQHGVCPVNNVSFRQACMT